MQRTSDLQELAFATSRSRWMGGHVWRFSLLLLILWLAVGASFVVGQTQPLPGWSQPPTSSSTSDQSQVPAITNDVRSQLGLAIPNETQPGRTQKLTPFMGAPAASDAAGGSLATDYGFQDTGDTPDKGVADPRSAELQATGDLAELSSMLTEQGESLTSREGLGSSIKVALLLAVLSLAPAIVLMTTCYVRVVVVLTLLRQAFGSQQLPPTQVLTALSLFLTLLVMAPVWNAVKTEAIDPYTRAEAPISWEEAWERGVTPIKRFMANQITASGNTASIAMFYKYLPAATDAAAASENGLSADGMPEERQPSGEFVSAKVPDSIDDVPINVLLPAFLISELKVAFLLGFQIYLPFLVLDLVVSSVTVSTGMMMLPPTMVSFPLKLILFVMVDGWNLVIGMLLQSFAPFT